MPDAVWALLDWVLPRCPNLGGVIFELFGSWFEHVGERASRATSHRLRRLGARHQPRASRDACGGGMSLAAFQAAHGAADRPSRTSATPSRRRRRRPAPT